MRCVFKKLRTRTVSLWSYINSFEKEFINNSYIEYDGVVECSTALSSLQLWVAYYFQYKDTFDDNDKATRPPSSNSSSKLQQYSKNNFVNETNFSPYVAMQPVLPVIYYSKPYSLEKI